MGYFRSLSDLFESLQSLERGSWVLIPQRFINEPGAAGDLSRLLRRWLRRRADLIPSFENHLCRLL